MIEMAEKLLKKTKSLCPECMKVVEAEVVEKDGKALIRKKCSKHGSFEDVYWSDAQMYKRTQKFARVGKGIENPRTKEEKGCPFDCGICPNHKSHTILGIIDVTNRCNMRCPICFANAAAAGYVYEPTFEQIVEMIHNLRANTPVPAPGLQLSGGEPTLRDDLPDIIRAAKKAGFPHVEVNSNGLRLAQDLNFVKKLVDAGVSTIYLQFDGVTPEPYKITRGQDILEYKLKAIENCRKAGITSIVLVVTLVKGVNDHQLGDIIKFAIKNIDVIKCVNVQPVSFAGRISQKDREKWRITIPDFLKAVEKQTGGQIAASDFYPVPCVVPVSNFVEAYKGKSYVEFTTHEHCGAATYVLDDGKIIPITRFVNVEKLFKLLDKYTEDLKRGGFGAKTKVIAKALKDVPSTIDMRKAPKGFNLLKIILNVLRTGDYSYIAEFHERALMIGCMHFMDAYNFDLERVERCGIHYAVPDGRLIPFCTMNSIHRPMVEKKLGVPISKRESKVKLKKHSPLI
jgi:uncharacterized radical SAM superfamily Fe-S cluster-containing enzyme